MKAISDYSTNELVDELDGRLQKMSHEEFIRELVRITDKINKRPQQ